MARIDERSLGDVLQDIFGNIQEIIRSEVRLTRAEIKTEAGKVTKAGKPLIAGAVLLLYAGGLFFLGLVYAGALVLPLWMAALAVSLVTAGIAALLISSGRRRLQKLNPTAKKTIASVKEDVQWLKDQTR